VGAPAGLVARAAARPQPIWAHRVRTQIAVLQGVGPNRRGLVRRVATSLSLIEDRGRHLVRAGIRVQRRSGVPTAPPGQESPAAAEILGLTPPVFDKRIRDGLQRLEALRITHARVRAIRWRSRPASAVANHGAQLPSIDGGARVIGHRLLCGGHRAAYQLGEFVWTFDRCEVSDAIGGGQQNVGEEFIESVGPLAGKQGIVVWPEH
jgi:hypothetical protein